MNHPEVAVLQLGLDSADFRHPQHGFNRCPTYDDWDACVWQGTGGKPTRAELEAVPVPAADQRAAALTALRAPFVYQGVPVATQRADTAFYDTMERANARNKLDFPTIIVGVDGSALIIPDSAAMTAFHGAVEAEANARGAAIKAALGL